MHSNGKHVVLGEGGLFLVGGRCLHALRTRRCKLLHIRKEEGLAHDVCLTLCEQRHMPILQNIADSELRHTGAVQTLLMQYDAVVRSSSCRAVMALWGAATILV